MTFITYGTPIGKPRMTRRDTWKQRPCVVRYRQWCDALRASAGLTDKVTFVKPHHLTMVAYFSIPSSWPKRLKLAAAGQPHACKPDIDNVCKGLMDAILEQDQNIFSLACQKRWDDGKGARIEVTLKEAR
jgi:Holliday junction resolvase RusA-like endonuclease